ncbi:MAG: rSAM-modified peptide [Porphyromonadaceae bacterium]|nr:MAG: rSAM-modified peptide [Porphyromonadaceae bacterium]
MNDLKLKLSALAQKELDNKKLDALKGGADDWRWCLCGCHGESSIADNRDANCCQGINSDPPRPYSQTCQVGVGICGPGGWPSA